MHTFIVNKRTNSMRRVKVGYSWTVLFFGFFPTLFRSDWKWFTIILLTDLLVGSLTMGFGSIIVSIIFSFVYNKLYVNDLLNNGYEPFDQDAYEKLNSKEYINTNNFHPVRPES